MLLTANVRRATMAVLVRGCKVMQFSRISMYRLKMAYIFTIMVGSIALGGH